MLCLNMQIRHYLIKFILICIDFQNTNVIIMKAGFKALVDIFKVFYKAFFFITVNQKIQSTAM